MNDSSIVVSVKYVIDFSINDRVLVVGGKYKGKQGTVVRKTDQMIYVLFPNKISRRLWPKSLDHFTVGNDKAIETPKENTCPDFDKTKTAATSVPDTSKTNVSIDPSKKQVKIFTQQLDLKKGQGAAKADIEGILEGAYGQKSVVRIQVLCSNDEVLVEMSNAAFSYDMVYNTKFTWEGTQCEVVFLEEQLDIGNIPTCTQTKSRSPLKQNNRWKRSPLKVGNKPHVHRYGNWSR